MENIKLDIKKLVGENLKKTRKEIFEEAFKPARESKSSEEFFSNVVICSSNLMEDGYSVTDIDNYILEQSMVDKADDALSQVKNADWGKIAKGSIMSSIKEFAIKWLLSNIGLKGTFAETAATVFADYNPLDLLKPFKDPQGCKEYMPKLCDSLLEAIGRQLGGQITNTTNAATTVVGNIFGESIRESNIGEVSAAKFCSLIHR